VRLTPATSELGLGSTLQLRLTALDADDNEVTGRSTVWASADTLVATVSESGLVTARRIGVVQLQAVVDGKSAFSVINVVAARVARVVVTPTSPSVAAGGSLQLTARTTDAAGVELSDRLRFWESSNNAVALVTSTGLVTGRTAGTATITATSEGASASVQVVVTGVTPLPPAGGGSNAPAPVDSVKVEPGDTTMVRNTTARFRARVFAGNRLVTDRTVVWSVTKAQNGADALTVNPATGEVTALNRPNSQGFVNATVEGRVGSATVNVTNKAAATVVITAPSTTLEQGQSLVLGATARDDDALVLSDQSVTWESSAPTVLRITTADVPEGSARVTALAVGSATITARTASGVRGTASFTVTSPPAPTPTTTTVDVTPASQSLVAGQTQQITATARDASGAVRSGRTFAWQSSAPSVATVSATGLVTAVGAGTATITVTVDGVTGNAVITVTVPPPPIVTARVVVSPPPRALLPTQTEQLTATAFTADSAPRSGRTFAWSSSNPGVATVSSGGLVTAVAPGTTTITAADGSVTGSTDVTVSRVPVASVLVTPATSTLTVGQTTTLSATPRDAAGATLDGRSGATWATGNADIATVSAAGVVTAVGAGTVTITGTIEGANGTATVIVNRPPAVTARVEVTPQTATIVTGGAQTFTAAAFDGDGAQRSGRTFVWTTSSAAIATVDDAGAVRGAGPGTATITATDGTVSGSATITVLAPPPAPVARVAVTPAARTLEIGQTVGLTAAASDAAGNVQDGRGPASWTSSNPAVATVSGAGLVTAVGAGSATVTGTIEGVNGTATITVNPPPPPPPAPVARVTVTPASRTLEIGQTVGLAAAPLDAAGNPLTGRGSAVWTSGNPAVATVNAAGVVTAVGAGTVTITGTIENVAGTATVTVNAPPPPAPVARVDVSGSPALAIGATAQLTATPFDAAGTRLDGRPAATWSTSSAAVATVSAAGLVTAVGAGSATITATIEGVNGATTITVNPPPVVTARVEVTPSSATIAIGGTRQLAAVAFDASGAARTGRSFTWTSSAPGVATVSAAGLVTAVSGGTATITAADGTVTGTSAITVTVPPPPPPAEPAPTTASVEVTPAATSIVVGATAPLTATARDAAGAARPGRTFTWQSSAPAVATVDAAGTVTAVSAGSATITATADGVNGTAAVTVTAPPPSTPTTPTTPTTPATTQPVAVDRVAIEPTSVTLFVAGAPARRVALLTAQPLGASSEPLTGRSCSWDGGRRADGRGRPIASVEPASPTATQVRAMDVGSTTVTATCEGHSATASVIVRDGTGVDVAEGNAS
jgi:uncharacterized protein YjdB